jgi:hypothetical protein
MTPKIPTFRHRRMADNVEFVYERGMTWITRAPNHDVDLSLGGDKWTPTHTSIALKHEVSGLTLNSSSLPPAGLEVLYAIDSLRHLSLGVDAPMDLAQLERLVQLKSLWLYWRLVAPPPVVAFDRLPRLEECRINLPRQFASILNCPTLTVLRIHATGFRDDAPAFVDLAGLDRLQELGVWHCSRVRDFALADKALVEALEVVNCRKLKIPWGRLGTTLKHLSLGGKLGFELPELTAAAKLETLMLTDVKFKGDLRFLKELPSLKAVDVPLPIGLSSRAKRTIQDINALNGHGPVLTTRA